MFHITEAEIMANWPEDEPIRVSVCCITYKQELYISQTINSFLMQKTMFPFEIIIGEDCGRDGTLSILERYQECYPNLIKVVTSEYNVGINANFLRVFDAARGNYIAVCEGDDYWIDELKLQKQYDYLRSMPDVNICFTAAKTLDHKGHFGVIANHSKSNTLIPLSRVVRGAGGFMPTASIFFKRIIVSKIPDWFKAAPVGDIYIQIIASIKNGAAYLPDITSVYRLNSIGSWSSSTITHQREICIHKNSNTLDDYLFYADSLGKLGVDNNDVAFLKAVTRSDAAKLLLVGDVKNCELDELKEIIFNMITASWSEYKNANNQQCLIYALKRFYYLPRFIFKFWSFIKHMY
ncbi:glycosyltransferase [Aeromonas veronii]|uniref:glycosyltransferase family 2 protein n=1 Tax=Aeromonas veronii TaxID=654 RepID=UPI001C5AACAA|nr:glycosyltransferase [Aeromonas veronii]MBW3775675.1 glycosyltransferase [Aeromonas veronii]